MMQGFMLGGAGMMPAHPTPYTLHPTPYTLHPTPYTLNRLDHTPTIQPSVWGGVECQGRVLRLFLSLSFSPPSLYRTKPQRSALR
jgi:hypothetical protein